MNCLLMELPREQVMPFPRIYHPMPIRAGQASCRQLLLSAFCRSATGVARFDGGESRVIAHSGWRFWLVNYGLEDVQILLMALLAKVQVAADFQGRVERLKTFIVLSMALALTRFFIGQRYLKLELSAQTQYIGLHVQGSQSSVRAADHQGEMQQQGLQRLCTQLIFNWIFISCVKDDHVSRLSHQASGLIQYLKAYCAGRISQCCMSRIHVLRQKNRAPFI